jgi:SAM-dependent methyltransferase
MSRSHNAMPASTITFRDNAFGGVLVYQGRSATAEFWDELWSSIDNRLQFARSTQGHLPHQLRATFRRWVPRGSSVLEAGCGLGHFTLAANALGYQAEGVDFAPHVIAKLNREFPEVRFFQGDVRSLTMVADGTYDALYSPGVCEHFESGPQDVLAEAHRVLKSGGTIVVSTPCFNALQKALYRFGKFRAASSGDFYQYAFSRRELKSVLEQIGFEIVQIHQYGVLLSLTQSVPVLDRMLPGFVRSPLGFGLDKIPGLRRIGHTCIWVGRKQ